MVPIVEIAPGIDLERHILSQMDFTPAISPDLRLMDAALFDDAPMNLRERMLTLPLAERIEFDGRADTLRLVGNGQVRRLRAGQLADEINGASIVWDNVAEVFRVEGGAVTPANPTGRVRMTLSPRAEAPAAPESPPEPTVPAPKPQ